MKKYKVRLASGRVLGPLDLERIQQLVLKNQIIGTEDAREHPQGEWKNINQFPELSEVLLAKIQNNSKSDQERGQSSYRPIPAGKVDLGSTVVLPGTQISKVPELQLVEEPPRGQKQPDQSREEESLEKTVIAPANEAAIGVKDRDANVETTGEKTVVHTEKAKEPPEEEALVFDNEPPRIGIANEQTIVFTHSKSSSSKKPQSGQNKRVNSAVRYVAVAAVLVLVVIEVFFSKPETKDPYSDLVLVRPSLPSYVSGKADPDRSNKLYREAMKYYVEDTVAGYRRAADLLLKAAGRDIGNVQALAMLASSYLNLIDSSAKDENYFSVISRLIEMSRAKSVDLTETVIADVEFFATVNRLEAAKKRIVDYTKVYENFGIEMYYYLSFVFLSQGDYENAAKCIAKIPDDKIFSPKVYYLRGLLAEKIGTEDEALQQYKNAVRIWKTHARSHLKISEILQKKGQLKEAYPHLEFLIKNPHLLAPQERAYAFYLSGLYYELSRQWDIALGYVENAVKLDRNNRDYRLELYTLRAKAGESLQSVRQKARTYYYLGEGEKLVSEGKYQEALIEFLRARQEDANSAIPPLKIGDMFGYKNDLRNALENYKKAAELDPTNIEIASKYIQALIQSYEWDEAEKAMDKLRKSSKAKSSIDKLAGDMYAKQGIWPQALFFYKKAMARDTIDPDVYIAFAKALMKVGNYKDAPFFFSLSLRFDPLNMEAVAETAKAISHTESIEQAVHLLQDENQKAGSPRAELLDAIAELQIQKGDWKAAENSVKQALQVNPDFANSWKLQAEIYLNNESKDKKAVEKALDAYRSFSERNPSDVSGHLERYRIFTKLGQFDKATEELDRIYEMYPKYPSLHYYKGLLYSQMGNQKEAVSEFKLELENHSNNVDAMVGLGKEYVKTQQLQEALKILTKAVQTDPRFSESNHWAGYVNYLLKNYVGAIALYRAALKTDEGNPMIYKRLGLAYQASGDQGSAVWAFRRYLELAPDAPDKAEFERYL